MRTRRQANKAEERTRKRNEGEKRRLMDNIKKDRKNLVRIIEAERQNFTTSKHVSFHAYKLEDPDMELFVFFNQDFIHIKEPFKLKFDEHGLALGNTINQDDIKKMSDIIRGAKDKNVESECIADIKDIIEEITDYEKDANDINAHGFIFYDDNNKIVDNK